MNKIFENVLNLIVVAMTVHAFLSFVSFYMMRDALSRKIRGLTFKVSDNMSVPRALSLIPSMKFKLDDADADELTNYYINIIDKVGLPALKALVGLTAGLWVTVGGIKLFIYLGWLAAKVSGYDLDDVAAGLFAAGLGSYIIYFILLARLDIVGLLVKTDSRYATTAPILLLIRLY